MEAIKRLILFFLALAVVLALAGCGTKTAYGSPPHVMTLVDDDMTYRIYQHDATGVWYLSTVRGLCVMVNPDGSPYIGEELPD